MPIIVPHECSDPEFYLRLEKSGSAVISQEDAERQDIRPARIGLLNLMPAKSMEGTELRWMRFISQTVLQIQPVLLKFDDDPRERPDSSRKRILDRYTAFSAAADEGLDALIITGDNKEKTADGEMLAFEDLTYNEPLNEVIDWARANVYSTIYSCLASQFALNSLHGVKRQLLDKKMLGVYDHKVLDRKSALTAGLDDVIRSPHSRWCEVPIDQMLGASALTLVAASEEAGWLIAEEESRLGGFNLYIQGHPEYWRNDLHEEFTRDASIDVPVNYYDVNNQPQLTWSNDARALHANWITEIYKSFAAKTSVSK